MILDTVALSAVLEGNPSIQRALKAQDRHQIPAIALGEYRFGLVRSKQRHVLEPLLDRLEDQSEVLEVGGDTARAYASLRDRLRAAGTPIAENDLWIAALAIEHGQPILSLDEHFDHVKGVRRVSW